MAKFKDNQIPAKFYSWFIDSVCSSHMIFDRSEFSSGTKLREGGIQRGSRSTAQVVGKNVIQLELQVEGKRRPCVLNNSPHVPDPGCQVISVRTIDGLNFQTSFFKPRRRINNQNENLFATASLCDGFHALDVAKSLKSCEKAIV